MPGKTLNRDSNRFTGLRPWAVRSRSSLRQITVTENTYMTICQESIRDRTSGQEAIIACQRVDTVHGERWERKMKAMKRWLPFAFLGVTLLVKTLVHSWLWPTTGWPPDAAR